MKIFLFLTASLVTISCSNSNGSEIKSSNMDIQSSKTFYAKSSVAPLPEWQIPSNHPIMSARFDKTDTAAIHPSFDEFHTVVIKDPNLPIEGDNICYYLMPYEDSLLLTPGQKQEGEWTKARHKYGKTFCMDESEVTNLYFYTNHLEIAELPEVFEDPETGDEIEVDYTPGGPI